MLDTFTRAYIDCALWSTTPFGTCFCEHSLENHAGFSYDTSTGGECSACDCTEYQEGDVSFQTLNYEEEDISPDTLARIAEDCRTFQEENQGSLLYLYGTIGMNYDAASAGHDFWLTRNGHGAGFWDRYYGKDKRILSAFKALTESCQHHTFDLYLGDDGKVWGS
jgi:hypothetical protein